MTRPVVIVTGASRGIGLGVTKALLTEFNAIVGAISRSKPAELVQLEQAHGESLKIYQCDIANEAALIDVISIFTKVHNRLDGLVLNAGVLEPLGPIADESVSLAAWKSHFDVNFFSLIPALRASLPALRSSQGRVIIVSSGAAVGSLAGWGPYNASKAALNSLCRIRTLANEEPDITAIALRPGIVDTYMQTTLRNSPDKMAPADHQRFIKAQAEGSLISPDTSGYLIASLALKAKKELHGQYISNAAPELEEYQKK
ncbi:short-chain dehydrogenase [Thelephora ganbajun]|uniref:Short-chain dehydrogenase n=1 Tax=Thelephora ganbajun TaxID=370292 RepID=A0ACB6ZRL3_THEGA|nr:short-chain dehydrogenase [Thelephora ganbajun]